MKKTVSAIGLLASLLASPQWAVSAEVPDTPHISTSGTATIQAKPDMATLLIEVNADASQASDAKKQADERVARYFDFLRQQGVQRKEINAANVSTQPRYDYSKAGQPKLLGYTASRRVTVTLSQLDKLNPVLDGALKAGLNEIRSVTMGVARPEQYQQQARAAAIKNAIELGQALAKGFNITFGPVWSIQYQSSQPSASPVYRMLAAKAPASGSNADQTYQQDTLDFVDRVNVVFELRPGQPSAKP